MSVIKSFAHHAHQSLSPLAPRTFKRSHVYELMAAGLGFKSWAALRPKHVIVDPDDATLPPDFDRNVLGRALQLGFSQAEAASIAETFQAMFVQQPFSSLALTALDELLFGTKPQDDDDSDLDDLDFDDDDERSDQQGKASAKRSIPKTSQLLLADLEDRAARGEVISHYRLAKLLKCKVPNDYLYQESLKGRILVAQEQRWVDEYLRLVPQREKFLQHLKAAADGGVRAANLDYAIEANDSSYRDRAVNMPGEIDWLALAETAPTADEQDHWLRQAAADGDEAALEELADRGDGSAAEQLAVRGDKHRLREGAESAIRHGDVVAAWKWYFVALSQGLDLTLSTMRAFHDGGVNDGEFYDSDFGGPLYVGGDEGLDLPKISDEQKVIAQAMAEQLLSDATD